MDLRSAAPDDVDAIRDVARRSFRASYSLSPRDIDEVVEEQLGDDALGERIDGGEFVVVVAEADGEVIGFVDGEMADGASELRWLHIAPEDRGRGAGTELVQAAHDELSDQGASELRLRVLADNSEGTAFAEHLGLERVDRAEVDLGGESYVERIFSDNASGEETTHDPGEPTVDVPGTVMVGGDELAVSDETVPGNEAPFYIVNEQSGERWGFFCGNCGSTDPTVDELDRVKCEQCANVHRPDEWDGAYL